MESIRISVGHTWRFVTGESACVDTDLRDYRGRIDQLKSSTASTTDFALPWPAYRSRLWTHMFNGAYQDTPSRVLVAALLPLRGYGRLPDLEQCRSPVEFEVLRHPFAVTTILHLELLPVTPWPPAAGASQLLHDLLDTPLEGDGLVQDGVPLDQAGLVPALDSDGHPLQTADAGRFVLLSGLHEPSEAGAVASCLASLFDEAPQAESARPIRSSGGAICVRDDKVGLVLPRDLPRAGRRLHCLHHNQATLLGYLQNLATLTPATPTEAARWFQKQAATMLNHLYRRAPLQETGTIYRSRLPELWITERGLPPFIDNLTQPPLVPLAPVP